MPAGRYSAGRIFLQVVPSFKGFQREIDREVKKANRAMGDGLEKEAGESGRRAGRTAGSEFLMGFSEWTSADQARLQRNFGKMLVDLDKMNRKQESDRERAARKLAKAAEAEAKRTADRLEAQRAKDYASAERWAQKGAERIRRERVAAENEHRKAMDKRAAEDRKSLERAHKLYMKRLDDEEAAMRRSMERRGGHARKAIEKAIAGIADSIGDLGFGRAIDDELEKVRRKARQVSHELSHGLIDTTTARRQVEALGRELGRLSKGGRFSGITNEDRGNIRAAISEVKQLSNTLDDAGRRGNRFSRFIRGSTGDANDGANAFRIFNYRVLAVASSIPLLIPLVGVLAGGFVALGSAVLGAAAGLGVMILGFSGIGDAVKALGDVQDNAAKDSLATAKAMRNASRGVRDAEQSLARARQQAARSAEDSGRRIAAAEKRLAETQRDATRAQEDLREARLQAQRDQDALADRIKSGQLDERQALIDLFEAQVAYNAAMADGGSTNLEKEQAAINLERARLAIKGVRDENKSLREEQAAYAKEGVNANEGVQRAQEQVRDSQQAVRDAEQDVRDARREASEAAMDSAIAIRDAQESLTDAQMAYQEALTQTGDIGSSSMQKLETAMGKLSPAGRAFALYLHSLRDDFYALRAAAQEGMLPGLMEGMETLRSRYGKGFLRFVGTMSKSLGDFFEKAAKVFTSPIFERFFAMMERNAPLFNTMFGDMFLNIATGLAGIMLAFEPFTKDMMEGILGVTESFAEWGATLSENEGFQKFLAWLDKTGPKVWKFVKAFAGAAVAIGVAMAPIADVLLDVFTTVFEYIANMDPDLLAAIVTGILGFVLASQAAAGVTQLFITLMTPFHSVLGAFVFLLIAAGAALLYLYQHNEDFRESVQKVFAWIKDNKDMLLQMAGFLGLMAGAFMLITKVILPAWAAIKLIWSAVMMAWRAFGFLRIALMLLGGPVGIIIGIITLLGLGFIWLWHNSETFRDVVTAVLKAVGDGAMWVWNNLLKPVFDFIGFYWTNVAAIIKWGFSIIGPIFELIGAIVSKLWEKVLSPVFRWIGEKFSWVGDTIQRVWMKYIDPILDFFGLGAEDLRGKWDAAISAIGSMWDGLKAMLYKPLEFIVNTIINKGFVDNFNKLARYFGTTEIDHLKLPALKTPPSQVKYGGGNRYAKPGEYYTGGYTGPGAKYQPAGVVHADEYVIKKESTNRLRRKYGLQVLDYMNAYGELPGMGGYAHGGLVDFGRRLQGMGFRVSEHPSFGGVQGSHSRTGWHYRGGAIDVNWPNGQRQSAEETAKLNAIVGLARQYGLRTIWQWKDHYDHAHFDIDHGGDLGNFAGAQGGRGSIPFWIEKPFEFLKGKVEGLFGKVAKTGVGKTLLGFPKKMLDFAKEKIQSWFTDMGDFGGQGDGVGWGSSVERWRDEVVSALRRVGQPTSLADTVLRRLQQESGGNPRAINLWDSNARAGIPSKGLMQVIDPTFRTWRDYRLSSDIYDPMANIVASMRYAMNRYGSLESAYNRTGGYAEGGLVTADGGVQDNGTMLYDNGGYLAPGVTQVVNLTGRPEPVFTASQFEQMAGGGSGGPAAPLIGSLTQHLENGPSADDVVDEIMFAMTATANAGKYGRG